MKSEFRILIFAIFTFICSTDSQTSPRINVKIDVAVSRSSSVANVTKSFAGNNSENSMRTSSPVAKSSTTASKVSHQITNTTRNGNSSTATPSNSTKSPGVSTKSLNSTQKNTLVNKTTTPMSMRNATSSSGTNGSVSTSQRTYQNMTSKATTLSMNTTRNSNMTTKKFQNSTSTSSNVNVTIKAKGADEGKTSSKSKLTTTPITRKFTPTTTKTTPLTSVKSMKSTTSPMKKDSTKTSGSKTISSTSTAKQPSKAQATTTKSSGSTTKSDKHSKPKNSNRDEKYKKQFVEWKRAFKKRYNNTEQEQKAEANYIKEAKEIDEHNNQTDTSYKRATTRTSDMTYKERVKKRMGLKMPRNHKSPSSSRGKREIFDDMPFNRFKRALDNDENGTLPLEVDYRDRFGPIRDQSECGACWAFVTTAVVEAYFYEKVGSTLELSVQELLDCNTYEMNCLDGGWPTEALEYVNNTGLASDTNYEYLSYMNECSGKRIKRAVKITDYCELDCKGNEEYLQYLVANYGPQAVVYYASSEFLSYRSGVFNTTSCIPGAVNHAVVVVGYGTDADFGDYWWIRNSWGPEWGEDGYGKIARNAESQCGIASYAFFPCGSEAIFFT